MQKLLRYLSEPYRIVLALVVLTGMRIGELLALRWRVVDFDAGTLHIRKSVFKDQFQTPKTSSAVRRIPIGPAA